MALHKLAAPQARELRQHLRKIVILQIAEASFYEGYLEGGWFDGSWRQIE
jgi:hypothetical protein